MKWLENNPLGIALASTCGVLILISVALVLIWGRPASPGPVEERSDALVQAGAERPEMELEPLSAYRVVTERPVFDETRRPVVAIEGEGIEVADEDGSEVGDRPQVRPTGIVITPEASMVTLQPQSGGEPILAFEGRPLTGDYVGWIVSDIKPRRIRLASLDGEVMELDLEVNTRKIAEPPKPAPTVEAETAAARAENGGAGGAAEDEEPLSRAEQIRQRIAERREELRRQAEANQSGSNSDGTQGSQYQSALRNMIRSRRANEEEKKNESGDSNDG